MSPEEFVDRAAARMKADGSEVSSVPLSMGPAEVGYRGEFRMRWAATKLHLFTVAVGVAEATPAMFGAVVTETLAYADATKGKMRGMQNGIAVIPIVAATTVGAEATAAAEARPEKGMAAFLLPALVDLPAETVHTYTGRILWGSMYASWLRERLAAAMPALTAR